jgi:uncharacterized surface protein with fasciclin (FAS1) repeats
MADEEADEAAEDEMADEEADEAAEDEMADEEADEAAEDEMTDEEADEAAEDEMADEEADEAAEDEMADEEADEAAEDEMADETAQQEPTQTVAEIAQSDENFSSLAAALDSAGLVETLNDPAGTFTVFAPTNDAFAVLGDTDLSGYALEGTLLYHVAGEVLTSEAIAEQLAAAEGEALTVTTVMGEELTIASGEEEGTLIINDSVQVVTADVMATNGVIHVIDSVLTLDEEQLTGYALQDANSYEAASTEFEMRPPAYPEEYASQEADDFFVLPVTVFAPTSDLITQYLDDSDSVDEFVIIFTSFNQNDLSTVFALSEDASNEEIINALLREDSQPGEFEETTVAGAPAVRVPFTNETSGKGGTFYLVTFDTEQGTDYLLIQGSSVLEQWEANSEIFEMVIGSITLPEPEEEDNGGEGEDDGEGEG